MKTKTVFFLFTLLLCAQFLFPLFLIKKQRDLLENGEEFKVWVDVKKSYREKNSILLWLHFPPVEYGGTSEAIEKYISENRDKFAKATPSDKKMFCKNFMYFCIAAGRNDDGFIKILRVMDYNRKNADFVYKSGNSAYPIFGKLSGRYCMSENKLNLNFLLKDFFISEKTLQTLEPDLKKLSSIKNFNERIKNAYAVVKVADGKLAIADVVLFGRSIGKLDSGK